MISTFQTAPKVAELGFAHGKVGLQYPLVGEEAENAFAENLGQNVHPVTIRNTAFCGDERWIEHFEAIAADYNTMEEYVWDVVTPQLLGGLGLAATKAAVAANLPIVEKAKSFTEAYLTVSMWLASMGQHDGGHDDCGASGAVLLSVKNQLPDDALKSGLGLFLPTTDEVMSISADVTEHKAHRLGEGFYTNWKPEDHKDYLIRNFPQYFATLKVDQNDQETHGHHGSGVLVVNRHGHGLAKNQFIEATHGQESFAVTPWKMHELAFKMGGSTEERRRLLVAFVDDTLHVAAGLVAANMPVFASGTNADIVNPISFNN